MAEAAREVARSRALWPIGAGLIVVEIEANVEVFEMV